MYDLDSVNQSQTIGYLTVANFKARCNILNKKIESYLSVKGWNIYTYVFLYIRGDMYIYVDIYIHI